MKLKIKKAKKIMHNIKKIIIRLVRIDKDKFNKDTKMNRRKKYQEKERIRIKKVWDVKKLG